MFSHPLPIRFHYTVYTAVLNCSCGSSTEYPPLFSPLLPCSRHLLSMVTHDEVLLQLSLSSTCRFATSQISLRSILLLFRRSRDEKRTLCVMQHTSMCSPHACQLTLTLLDPPYIGLPSGYPRDTLGQSALEDGSPELVCDRPVEV